MTSSLTHHQQILTQIKALSDKSEAEIKNMENYLGTAHSHYGLKAAARKKIVANFKKQQQVNFEEFVALLDQLYYGQSYEERAVAGEFLQRYSTFRKKLSLAKLDEWLGQLVGWAEVDGTCQSNFTAQELLGNWPEWQNFLTRLSQDKNINKRRASLVLLVKAVRRNDDQRLVKQALSNIERVWDEKGILVTKAISWLLREMTKQHKELVRKYIEQNKEKLPAIAYREAKNKIETGRK